MSSSSPGRTATRNALALAALLVLSFVPQGMMPVGSADAAAPAMATKFGQSGTRTWATYGTGEIGRETTIGVPWMTGNGKDAFIQLMQLTYCLSWDDSVPFGVNPPMTQTDCTSEFTRPGNVDPILFTDFDGTRTFAGGLQVTPDTPAVPPPAGAIADPCHPSVAHDAVAGVIGWPYTCMQGCSVLAYTDDDATDAANSPPIWFPAGDACSLPAWDHETIVVGPWAHPAPASASYDRAVYYCSQLGIMGCWVSYDGGVTFGPASSERYGVVPTGGADPTEQCAGLHGHARITRGYEIDDRATNDGPHMGHLYLPNKSCHPSGTTCRTTNPMDPDCHAAFAVSTDNSLSWRLVVAPEEQAGYPNESSCDTKVVPDVGPGHFDPSVAPSLDHGWVYIGQGVSDGPGPGNNAGAYIAMTKTNGVTWEDVGTGNGACPGTKWFNVGALAGVQQATFAEVIVGDDDRAAFAFLGSTTSPNDYDQCGGISSAHVWHLYVAVTYDAGVTWTVDQATTDPVQRGGIWPYGGGAVCRNLLDFNDIVTDKYGRILVSFTDGCAGPCAAPGGSSGMSTGTEGAVARQVTGRGLLAKYDIPDPPPDPLDETSSGPGSQGPDELAPAPDGATDTGDLDEDGVYDMKDNCPRASNLDQVDSDLDGSGDACDGDDDDDRIPDLADNCPKVANFDQQDANGDSLGNACDPDADGDGLLNAEDNCWTEKNVDQANMDNDAFGDACDADRDGDSVPNASDAYPDESRRWLSDNAAPAPGDLGQRPVNRIANAGGSGAGGILLVGALVVAAGIAALALLMMRRKE